jgi:hypothetical protein
VGRRTRLIRGYAFGRASSNECVRSGSCDTWKGSSALETCTAKSACSSCLTSVHHMSSSSSLASPSPRIRAARAPYSAVPRHETEIVAQSAFFHMRHADFGTPKVWTGRERGKKSALKPVDHSTSLCFRVEYCNCLRV